MNSILRHILGRPVATTAFYILVVVLAGLAYMRLPVALLPSLEYPALAVWTAYPDVPPEQVERTVTEPVEGTVSGIAGLQELTSRSQMGGSLVRMNFGWNTDVDRVLLDVREQLARLGGSLPEEANRPVVLRIDPSQRPVMMLALSGARDTTGAPARRASTGEGPTRQDLTALKQIGQEVVARRLEQLDDVARVRVTGGYERQIDVMIDRDRMAALGVGLSAIEQALQQSNVALPGGFVRRGPFQYAVEVSSEYDSPEDIAGTVITRAGGPSVRLSELATVRESVAERQGLVRLNGRETLLLLVETPAEANTVEAASNVRRALTDLDEQLTGAHLEVVVDESQFIQASINGVAQAVWLGGLLAIIVLFAFLRRWRALLAVGLAVPLSLALTFILFDLANVTFNLIALGGLALGVGMLVDNAIIVTENIARLREEGASAMEAAREGAAEVGMAITASTLTTIAVFFPITFIEGLAGRLFRDQSLAVVFSLLASLLVALTAVPLISSRDRAGGRIVDTRSGLLYRWYERALSWCLRRRAAVIGGALLLLIGSGVAGYLLPREVVPDTDQGRVQVHLTMPPEADLSLVSERSARLEERLRQWPEVQAVLADLGQRDQARLTLDPRPPHEGDLTLITKQPGDVEVLTRRLTRLAERSATALEVRPVRTQLEALLVPQETDLTIDLVADRRADARAVADSVFTALQEVGALSGVNRAAARAVPAYRLTFKRDALLRFGMSPREIATYLQSAARGVRATELRQINEEVPIMLRAGRAPSMEQLLARQIPSPDGLRPLGTFVTAERVELPARLYRAGQAPITRFTAEIAPGYDLAAATGAAEAVFGRTLRPGVQGEVGGANEAFRRSLRAVGWSLLLSLLIVYLILAAQFESLLQPLVILAAVPLAAGGVVLVLAATGQSINLMSLTGCVVLVGIVVNDAIVKVDFINQRRATGMDLIPAIKQAGRDRVRPILMTTITTVLGLLPLAIGWGAGAELRAPLAIAIVGGLISATVLTLLVVPVLYLLAARLKQSAH